ncbi:anthocyanidin 3-O-glucosyltransferase 5-like [Argentina anserina]|uniref:anthocyanidin 3-O-glucosyltransferase 5-like n=1 Tax=Argentina anserina TaxID=57926 RepID=UPI0021765BA4|nr:anthocyanidin 3-O-glucosyltransferase 5-like [Potentilla anserina]
MVLAESYSLNEHHGAVLPSPGMGHIIPLLEFAKRLVVHHGFRVSFVNITTEASTAQTDLLHSTSLPSGLHVVDLPPTDVSSLVNDEMLIVHRIGVIVEESLKCLDTVLIQLGKPKALIIDVFCTQGFDVGKQLSIPVYSFFTPSAAFCAFTLYHPTMDREVEGEFIDLPEPVKVPGCSPVRTEDLLDQIRNRKNDEYRYYFGHVRRLCEASGIFLNTWEDLEPVPLKAIRENPFYQKILTPPVYPIRPLIKEHEEVTKVDAKYLAWLDQQPEDSVLFIVPGSGGTMTAAQVIEFAWGLELSQQRFIWVVRKPSDASASATFFNVGGDVNDPKAYLPENFVERTRGRGVVVRSWASQVAFLRHRVTGGFLSHCGWNSSLESMTYGVPIIAWPLYAEQRANATMLAEEIGVAVKPVRGDGDTVFGREEIERVVRLLMEGEEGKVIRSKAKKLQESAAKALDSGGCSYESLSRVVKRWKDLSAPI